MECFYDQHSCGEPISIGINDNMTILGHDQLFWYGFITFMKYCEQTLPLWQERNYAYNINIISCGTWLWQHVSVFNFASQIIILIINSTIIYMRLEANSTLHLQNIAPFLLLILQQLIWKIAIAKPLTSWCMFAASIFLWSCSMYYRSLS